MLCILLVNRVLNELVKLKEQLEIRAVPIYPILT